MTGYNITVEKGLLPELLSSQDGLAKLVEGVLNQILEAQVSENLGADKHQRSDERTGYRNGYRPRQLYTRVGPVNQKRTGLDVIKIVNIKRAVLVTSHYKESDTQKEIIRLGAKLLPKQLANSISIRVSHQQESCPNNELHTVSAIWLDDDPSITDLNCQLMAPLIIDVFRSPLEMMNIIEMRNYPKDIPIFLDNNFEGFPEVTGIDIAIKLHQLGFTKLRLLSGQDLGASDISPPEYLIIIPKYAASELDQYF